MFTGDPPKHCQLCGIALEEQFVDGRLARGQWAYMCKQCHTLHGVGLGLGKGQLFSKEGEHFTKIEG